MKTYNIIKGIFAATVLSVVFSGCSEDAMDRINKDHGHTQSVAARFILTDSVSINTRMDLGVAPTALRMPREPNSCAIDFANAIIPALEAE